MDIKQVKCRSCGALMHYEPGMLHIKCEFCGSEYLLQPAASEQMVQNITDKGGCLFRSFVPPQWQIRTRQSTKLFSVDAPLCMDLILTSPVGSMLIMNPFAYYKDSRSPVLAIPGDEQLDYGIYRHLCRRPLEEYLPYAVDRVLPNFQIRACKKCTEEENALAKRAQAYSMEASQKLKGKAELCWGSYALQLVDASGQLQPALFATVQAAKQKVSHQPSPQQNAAPPQRGFSAALKRFLDYGMSGGLLGHRGTTGGNTGFGLPNFSGGMPTSGSDWGVLFDIVLLYKDCPIEKAHTLLTMFIEHLQYGPRYYQLQQEEADRTAQIMLEGQRQRQQNAFRGWQSVHQTQTETTDIINRGFAQRQATMDRVYDNISQGIRGVNTYESTSGGSFEAGVRYEHVYQNGSTFVGSTDGSVSLGPDWVEVKRK